MLDLNFEVCSAEPHAFAAGPTLVFKLRITNGDGANTIHSILLRCQIQIEPTRRRYTDVEQDLLLDLFGEPTRWSQTLRTMLWTHTSTTVGPFTIGKTIDLQVLCTFDFNVAATKYFAGLENGEVPLVFQFSGTVFYGTDQNGLQVAQIPWSKETRFRLPVRVWSDMMEVYYPNSVWLNLRRDIFDELYRFKIQQGIPTWEGVMERLLAEKGVNIRDGS